MDFDPPSSLVGGTLSPDLQPNTPPTFPQHDSVQVSKIGKYLLLDGLDMTGSIQMFHAVHTENEQEFVCKVRNQHFIYYI